MHVIPQISPPAVAWVEQTSNFKKPVVECASALEELRRCWTSGRLRFGREQAEQQRLWQAEQEAQAERDCQAAAAALAAKEAERCQLASLARRFALRLEGSVSIAKPPQVRTISAWSGGVGGTWAAAWLCCCISARRVCSAIPPPPRPAPLIATRQPRCCRPSRDENAKKASHDFISSLTLCDAAACW